MSSEDDRLKALRILNNHFAKAARFEHLEDEQVKLVLDAMDAYAAEQSEVLIEALKKSVKIIEGWHNMGSPSSRLTKEQIDSAWDIYYNHSPEMKPIREELKQFSGE